MMLLRNNWNLVVLLALGLYFVVSRQGIAQCVHLIDTFFDLHVPCWLGFANVSTEVTVSVRLGNLCNANHFAKPH